MGYEDMIDKKRVLAEFLELIAIPCSTHDERQKYVRRQNASMWIICVQWSLALSLNQL